MNQQWGHPPSKDAPAIELGVLRVPHIKLRNQHPNLHIVRKYEPINMTLFEPPTALVGARTSHWRAIAEIVVALIICVIAWYFILRALLS